LELSFLPLKTKPHCRDCKYYLKEVDKLKADGTPDTDVCGYTLNKTTNPLGDEVYKTYGGIQYCDECEQPLHDSRKVIYKRCIEKNKDFKCEHFTPKWYLRLLYRGTKDGNNKRKKSKQDS